MLMVGEQGLGDEILVAEEGESDALPGSARVHSYVWLGGLRVAVWRDTYDTTCTPTPCYLGTAKEFYENDHLGRPVQRVAEPAPALRLQNADDLEQHAVDPD